MKPARIPPLALLLTIFGLSACAPTTPRMDSRFGESVRLTVAQQVLNPDAAMQAGPEMMDGPATRESILLYRNNFKEPPAPQNVFNIGVGAGGSR